MKSKSLILIVIACGCGLVASIGISQVMDRGGGAAQAETVKILVALNDVNIFDKLDAQNVKLEDWPKDRVPEGAFMKLEDVKGQFTHARLYKGEPVLKAKLSNSKNGPQQTIPEGFRVVPISVERGVVTDLVQPGDRIDILVFMKQSAEVPMTTTKTVLTDVRIFAVNDKTERAKEKENETIQARTVSVLVKPDQVEMLMLAMELGKIKLSLRSPSDKKDIKLNGATSSELLANSGASGTDPVPVSVPEIPVNSAIDVTKQPSQGDLAATIPQGPTKTMTVHTPTGTMQYVWRDGNDLPEVITLGEGAGASTAPALPAPAPTTGAADGGKNSPPEKTPTDVKG